MAKNTPKSRAEEKAAAAQRREARKEKAAKQAAALAAARARRKRREQLTVGGIVAVVLVLLAGIVWWNVRDTGPVDAPANVVDGYALAVGDPDAEHEVTIYEDFLCPACGDFEKSANVPLSDAAQAGKVYVKYYPFELLTGFDDYSRRALNALAVVLDESGPDVAKEFHDALYAAQPAEGGEMPDDDWLVQKAAEAGADADAVRPGIEDMAFGEWVDETTDHASKEGVRATPTILVDGQVWENTGDIASLMELIN